MTHKTLLLSCLVVWTALSGCEKEVLPGMNGQFIRIYGTEEDDAATSLIQLDNGDFIIGGYMANMIDTMNGQDIAILLTDENGLLQSRKLYGGRGIDRLAHIVAVPGGCLAIGSWTNDSTMSDMYIMKLAVEDDTLRTVWARMEGGSGIDYGINGVVTPEGDYVIVGVKDVGSNSHILLTKYSPDGNLIWQTEDAGNSGRAEAYSIVQLSDGGFAVAGNEGNDPFDAAVWKFDANGSKSWGYRSTYNMRDEGKAVVELGDGNLGLVGQTLTSQNYQLFMQVLELSGDSVIPVTYREFGGSDHDRMQSRQMVQNVDGSIICAGFSQSFGAGGMDFCLFKITSASADSISVADTWHPTFGGANDDAPFQILSTRAPGYAIVGHSRSFNGNHSMDMVFVHTNAEGYISSDQ